MYSLDNCPLKMTITSMLMGKVFAKLKKCTCTCMHISFTFKLLEKELNSQ